VTREAVVHRIAKELNPGDCPVGYTHMRGIKMGEFNDLRLLTVFVTVYRKNGISAASRVLNISQPAVTRTIRKLEHELGQDLFDRTPTGIVATEFGVKLYRRALAIIDEVDSIYADIRHLGNSDRRLVRVGVGTGCWPTVCDPIVSYRQRFENVVFNVTVSSARGLIDEIEAGSLDLLVANKKTVDTVSWFHVEPWIVLDNFHVARETHPVFSAPVETQLDVIQNYPFTTYHMLENAHGSAGAGSAAIRADDFLFLLHHAARSDCYMTVSEKMIAAANALGLRVVGNRAIGATEYAIAYPREGATENTLAFAKYVVDSGAQA
jgi:DNA-binding transcriptional LysR family regulator